MHDGRTAAYALELLSQDASSIRAAGNSIWHSSILGTYMQSGTRMHERMVYEFLGVWQKGIGFVKV